MCVGPNCHGGFPGGSVVKHLLANVGDLDMGSIPGSGRSPGGGNSNPFQYSCLENPKDRGAQPTVPLSYFITLPWQLHAQEATTHLSYSEATSVLKKIIIIYLLKLQTNYFTILWWFLPYTDMNQPWVYISSPSWTPSHLPPHLIPQGHPSAPALSTLSHASNLDWRSISYMIVYMFQCCSLKSSHPHLLPQSPKVYSLHLCLFCCLAYRVIVTIFLNPIYMCQYTILVFFLPDLLHSVY